MKHSAIWRSLRRVAAVYAVVRLPFEIVDDVKRFFSFLDDARRVVRTVTVAVLSGVAALPATVSAIPTSADSVRYQITSSMTNGTRDITALYDPTATVIVAEWPLARIANQTHSNAMLTGTTVSLPESTAAFRMTVTCGRWVTISCRPY